MDRCFLSLLLRRMGFAGNGLGVGKLPGAAASLPRACLRRCSDGYGPDGPLLSDVETSPVPSALLLLPSTQVTPNFLFPHHFYAFWSHWKELAFGSTCQFSPLARKNPTSECTSPRTQILPVFVHSFLGTLMSLLCFLSSPARPSSETTVESILSWE